MLPGLGTISSLRDRLFDFFASVTIYSLGFGKASTSIGMCSLDIIKNSVKLSLSASTHASTSRTAILNNKLGAFGAVSHALTFAGAHSELSKSASNKKGVLLAARSKLPIFFFR